MPRRFGIKIPGVVQGMGFRPWIHRQATAFGLTGSVRNTGAGVLVEVQSESEEKLHGFLGVLRDHPDDLKWDCLELPCVVAERGFEILPSLRAEPHASDLRPVLSPDRAICALCREEWGDPQNRRYRYPFLGCAECGPRQSVTSRLPFDRAQTSFSKFEICTDCEQEYTNKVDRRFHAQTITCPQCGPNVEILDSKGSVLGRDSDAISRAAEALRNGKIIAVKGGGGFHLMVDATNELAVLRLRERKRRPAKPFALMVDRIETADEFAAIKETEARLLKGSEACIVLLRLKQSKVGSIQECDSSGRARTPSAAERLNQVAFAAIAPRLNRVGIMLASTALHLQLLEEAGGVVVATSGNLSEEPICFQNDEALRELGDIADFFLVHNLDIVHPQDDSVAQVVDGKIILLRRSKGFPLRLQPPREFQVPESRAPLLSAGADLKSALGLWNGTDVVLGSYLGSLDCASSVERHSSELVELPRFFGGAPREVVVDAHPDYRSTRSAEDLGLPLVLVQHHLAHVAAGVLEHGLVGQPVIGVVWDGTGYGLDGTSWGGEFFQFSKKCVVRSASLRPFRLYGGDAAAREPCRVGLALGYEAGPRTLDWIQSQLRPWLDADQQGVLLRMHAFAPKTSSVGRLFDGVAAILGIRGYSQYEAQAAIELQGLAEEEYENPCRRRADKELIWQVDLSDEVNGSVGQGVKWDVGSLVRELVERRREGESIQSLALAFHRSLAALVVAQAKQMTDFESGERTQKVILTGGVFQNALLLRLATQALVARGFDVYWAEMIPGNDGGIAMGQLLCALEYREELSRFQTLIKSC